MLYPLMRALVRLTVHLFFRRVDVEAPHNVPSAGPVLLVANHTNALVDPLIIMTAVRRPVTVTAKSALANNVLLRWLMRACGVVTFQREQDVPRGTGRRGNLQSVQQCQNVLARGGAICIFPEGVSHSDSKLRAFRSGAARIAMQYVRQNGNPGRLQIVPVGLLYTAKDQFRSEVLLRFGDPLDVEGWLANNQHASPADLTQVIEHRVAALTINTPSRREQLLLAWGAEIVATQARQPRPLGSDEESTAEWFHRVDRLLAGSIWLDQNDPDALKQLSHRIRAYRRQLRMADVTPAEVFLPMNPGRAAFFLLRELELMILGGPLALLGAINHAAPYFTVKTIATRLSRDKDHWASNAIYPSFMIFPFFYVVQLAAAWRFLPPLWAGLYTVALPYTGYYAILYGDRFVRAWRRIRTFTRFALQPDQQRQLATEGRSIVQEVRRLGQLVEGQQVAS